MAVYKGFTICMLLIAYRQDREMEESDERSTSIRSKKNRPK